MAKKKQFHEYITPASKAHIGHKNYSLSPGTAFLKYTIEAKDAIDLAIRHFPKKQDKTYAEASFDGLQYLGVALLPAIMGHFETYQRFLFAGAFDYSVFLKDFNVSEFVKSITKNNKEITVDIVRLSAYRNIGATSIGNLIADSLPGWHDTNKVNQYFSAFHISQNLYSSNFTEEIDTLWQLRHSIVHTGGTLTLPDSLKYKNLNEFGDKQLAFDHIFTSELSRKFHLLTKESTENFGKKYIAKLNSNISTENLDRIKNFFNVTSSIPSWFKKK